MEKDINYEQIVNSHSEEYQRGASDFYDKAFDALVEAWQDSLRQGDVEACKGLTIAEQILIKIRFH